MFENLAAMQNQVFLTDLSQEYPPGGGTSYPLQYSCLENPIDSKAWQAIVHGITELDTTEQLTFQDGRLVNFLLDLEASHMLTVHQNVK